jgi:peroxiredoxin
MRDRYETTVAGTKLMMLPTDVSPFAQWNQGVGAEITLQMALIEDPKFKVWVEKYAADQDLFFKDFALAFAKLIGEWRGTMAD